MKDLLNDSDTRALGKAGLAAGTTTTLTSANQMDYYIKGKLFRKATATNEATPTTDAVTGLPFVGVQAGKGSVFTTCRDAAGALKVVQGRVVDLGPSGSFALASEFGPFDSDFCPYGYILVRVAPGGATWTFGSSNLAGPPANTTITFVDGVPLRPQVS